MKPKAPKIKPRQMWAMINQQGRIVSSAYGSFTEAQDRLQPNDLSSEEKLRRVLVTAPPKRALAKECERWS